MGESPEIKQKAVISAGRHAYLAMEAEQTGSDSHCHTTLEQCAVAKP